MLLLFFLCFFLFKEVQNQEQNRQVTWFVHISDIHLSKWQMNSVDPRERDLESLFQNVISKFNPAAVLLTGDLTDSKTKGGKGKQHPVEWEAYGRVVNMMKNSTGLSDILDVRGNHDTFDAGYKGGEHDYYPTFGARGKLFQQNKYGVLMMDEVYGQIGGSPEACPAVVMIGLDLTADPGFRGPTNFAAMISEQTMEELDQEIKVKLQNYKTCKDKPTILAYGHYPLCVAAYTHVPLWKQALHVQTVQFKLQDLFQKYNVSAYFNGHLHNAFGERLHQLIPAQNQEYIAELQAADWKYSRRFRIVTIDDGQLAFSDHQFHHSNCSHAEISNIEISSIEDNFKLVNNFLVVVTAPVDGRYAPLVGSSNKQISSKKVRALIFLVGGTSQRSFSVEGTFKCSADNSKQFIQMWKYDNYQSGNQFLFEGHLPSEVNCTGDGNITVSVLLDNNQMDSFSSIPIQLQQQKNNKNYNQSVKPMPLNQQFFEKITLKYSWPIVGFWMFYGSWSFVIGCLLIFPFLISKLTQFLTIFEDARSRRDLWTFFLTPMYYLCNFSFQGFSLWIFYLIYVIYLGFFPWLLIKLVDKFPYGFALPFCVIIPFGNQFQYFPTPELLIVFSMHLILVIIPLTFLISWFFSRCSQMECEHQNKKRFVNIWQVIFLLIIIYFHIILLKMMVKWYGIVSVIVSPGMGWLLPLLILFVCILRKQQNGYCKCE